MRFEEQEQFNKQMEVLALESARTSLIGFAKYIRGYDSYKAEFFHKQASAHIQALLMDNLFNEFLELVFRLFIHIPPQHGKSELVSRLGVAWFIGLFPNYKICLVGYNQTFANKLMREVIDIITSPEYKRVFPHVRIAERGQDNKGAIRRADEVEIVGYEGLIKAVGVSGGITGYSFNLIVIDDPIKSRKEANSITYRENLWSWFNDECLTRLSNGGKVIGTWTRWHEDGLEGRFFDPKNEHYNEKRARKGVTIFYSALREREKAIPWAKEVKDPRPIDGALWEEKHSAEKYKIKRETEPTSFASLDQQRPRPIGGNLILKDWLQQINVNELPFNVDRITPNYVIDSAYTEKTENDATAVLTYYVYKGVLYILNCVAVRKSLGKFIEYFQEYTQQTGYKKQSKVYIELKASGESLRTQLRDVKNGAFNTVGIPNKFVREGKVTRVMGIEPFLSTGKVLLVSGGWNKSFIEECLEFPNGRHDDRVDTLTYACYNVFMRGGRKGVKVGRNVKS